MAQSRGNKHLYRELNLAANKISAFGIKHLFVGVDMMTNNNMSQLKMLFLGIFYIIQTAATSAVMEPSC